MPNVLMVKRVKINKPFGQRKSYMLNGVCFNREGNVRAMCPCKDIIYVLTADMFLSLF